MASDRPTRPPSSPTVPGLASPDVLRWFRRGRIAAVVLLVLALGQWPYGYYTLLRVIVTAVACYGAWFASLQARRGWRAIFVGIAILFNPIIPIHLSRDAWALIDLVVAAVLLSSVVALRMAKGLEGEGPPGQAQ